MNAPHSRRPAKIFDLAFLIVVSVLGWLGYSKFQSQTTKLEHAREVVATCKSLAPQIEALRKLPDQALLDSHSFRMLAESIEASCTLVKMTPEQIIGIEPQGARRVEDTPYLEHATIVQLELVTMIEFAELATKLGGLDDHLGQLHITALRINAPSRPGAQKDEKERWNIEFTLTYFVFSPKSRITQSAASF